jgi:hypothetical protein
MVDGKSRPAPRGPTNSVHRISTRIPGAIERIVADGAAIAIEGFVHTLATEKGCASAYSAQV